jgi:hypothetical protein
MRLWVEAGRLQDPMHRVYPSHLGLEVRPSLVLQYPFRSAG